MARRDLIAIGAAYGTSLIGSNLTESVLVSARVNKRIVVIVVRERDNKCNNN